MSDVDIEGSIQSTVAEARETPNTWFTTSAQMSYNRFMKLKTEFPDIDWKFEGVKDEDGSLVGTTPAGNSSGSREGYAHAYRYVEQETG